MASRKESDAVDSSSANTAALASAASSAVPRVSALSSDAPSSANAAFPAPIADVADVDTVKALTDRMRPALQSAIEDAIGAGREGVNEFLDDLGPEIAKQTLLSQSALSDPAMVERAKTHARHLRGQVITRAGTRIIGFEQRQEMKLVGIVEAAISFARHWLTGGAI